MKNLTNVRFVTSRVLTEVSINNFESLLKSEINYHLENIGFSFNCEVKNKILEPKGKNSCPSLNITDISENRFCLLTRSITDGAAYFNTKIQQHFLKLKMAREYGLILFANILF